MQDTVWCPLQGRWASEQECVNSCAAPEQRPVCQLDQREAVFLGRWGKHSGNGSQRIAMERIRQRSEEGYNAIHDKGHGDELLLAAACYALGPDRLELRGNGVPVRWPWDAVYWKPGPDRIRDLEKAGALIAAAIDAYLADDYLVEVANELAGEAAVAAGNASQEEPA